jgi:hypothetical protein
METPQSNKPEKNTTALQRQPKKEFALDVKSPRIWPAFVFAALLLVGAGGGVAGIVLASTLFTGAAAIATFITGSIVGLFTLLAIAAQVFVYWEQRNLMARQWNAMLGGIDRTDRIIEKMQAQLHQMQEQSTDVRRQIELSKLSESAYLSVADLEIPLPLHGYNLAVNGKIYNRGKTPAFRFQRLIQIATGKGEPPVGWGRFEWNFNPEECEDIMLAAGDCVNFTTTLPLKPETLAQLNENEQTIVIDGQCRYLDHSGDLLIYRFGLTVDLGPPPRSLIRYQNHERNEANPN